MNKSELKAEYDRVVKILKGISDGSKKIENVPGWSFCDHIAIYANCYAIVIFIDCNEIDYVDSVITSKGKEIDFWDFHRAFDRDPMEELSDIEIGKLEDAIEKANMQEENDLR